MRVVVDVEGMAFPTQTVEVLDVDEVLLRLQDAKQLEFCDPEGLAHKKGKQVYVAALRRGLTLTLRYGTRVGNKIYSVTLALPGVVEKTKRGRRSNIGKES